MHALTKRRLKMLFNKNELLAALENQALKHNLKNEIVVNEVVIDSRKCAPQKLFFALKGENNDGHDFLEQVFANGCEVALVHDAELLTKFPNHNLILVKNTFDALYEVAKFSRARSTAKIIAITGSVGKTGTKEMLRDAFLQAGKTHATIGNLNNHFGVPLTLCNMPRDTKFAVLEMGMNHLKEIEPLSKLARPHIAVITTIAPAHIGNFKNEKEIALAKSEIFSGLEPQGFAIINRDNKYYDFLKNRALEENVEAQNILSFGQNEKSDYCLKEEASQPISAGADDVIKIITKITATTKNHGEISYEIATIHHATIINSLIVVACLDLAVQALAPSLKILENLASAKGRGEIIVRKIDGKNIVIIDDSYNANVLSMKAGLEYLMALKKILHKKRAVAALGDMFELGEKSQEFHDETLKFADNLAVDFVFLAGNAMKNSAKILNNKCKTFDDSAALALEIKGLLQDGDILLIKGSRGMKMEKAIETII